MSIIWERWYIFIWWGQKWGRVHPKYKQINWNCELHWKICTIHIRYDWNMTYIEFPELNEIEISSNYVIFPLYLSVIAVLCLPGIIPILFSFPIKWNFLNATNLKTNPIEIDPVNIVIMSEKGADLLNFFSFLHSSSWNSNAIRM